MGATLRSGDMTLTVPPMTFVTTTHLLAKEWLVTNGLGGYASGTLLGASTRRYHGMLVPTGVSLGPHGHHSATR